MIKPMIRAALCCFMLMVGLSACTNQGKTACTDQEPFTLNYRFATQEEGRKLKLADTDYLEALTQEPCKWAGPSSCYRKSH